VTDPIRQLWWRVPRAVTVTALAFMLAACGDDPFSFDWSDRPDTVQIYSLARPELNLFSGFSFFDRVAVRVEDPNASGAWDIALDTRNSELVLLPPGALGITARARISTLRGVNFDDVVEAPGDTLLYEGNQPVPVVSGTVYVVSTNRRLGNFGSNCVYYAKMEPVLIDVVEGILRFRYVSSPICNSRDLTPPD
jgi:hypothetical protein